jgi:hypothetical protein
MNPGGLSPARVHFRSLLIGIVRGDAVRDPPIGNS